ncbi:MAG: flavin reductase [Clostridia bacterium]|nr:flavin reductase [Clostridia bacterium]
MANIDNSALFKIGYGLYVITSSDGVRDNGMIANTVVQLTSNPVKIAVTLNKATHTHDIVRASGKMNVCMLTESAPFSVFEKFGFQSGRDTDKFADCTPLRSENGLIYLPHYSNAYISLRVTDYIDFGSHGCFVAEIAESAVLSNEDSMTYAYYHKNVKPKPAAKKAKGYVCKICGYVHEEDELPDDFVCPLCYHGAEDFEPIN